MKQTLLSILMLLIGLVKPSNANAQIFKKLRNDTNTNNNREKKIKKEDQGMTSPVHERNVKKIIWSSSPIQKGNEDERAFKTKFRVDEFIYARVYMLQSAENEPLYPGRVESNYHRLAIGYYVYIDGTKQNWIMDHQELAEDRIWTTRQIWLRPDPKIDPTLEKWKNIVDNLPEGEHTVRFEMIVTEGEYSTREPMAVGEFILVKGANDSKLKIGKTFDSYKSNTNDRLLEENVLQAIQNYGKRARWKETFVDVKIDNENLKIFRNQISGIVTSRTLSAYCCAKWPDGRCTVQYFSFTQEHDGQNYIYGTTKFEDGGLPPEEVDCMD